MTYNPGANTVSISTGVDLLRVTAAYGNFNYLIEERKNTSDAWGPIVWNPLWGVEPQNYTAYLYWNIHRATGVVTRGFTPNAPTFSNNPPVDPAIDQHWFDLNTIMMKVWNGTAWRVEIRVFAASFVHGTQTITENELGSQVDLVSYGTNQVDWADHGYILFGQDQKGIRFGDANFATTATPVNTNHGSFSSPIRLELLNSTVLASEPIPAFYAVSNAGDGTVGLANGTDVSKRPIGVTMNAAITGDPIDIVTHGILFNDQWQWNTSGGAKDLYCGLTGEMTQGAVSFTAGAARIGTILSENTVLIDIDLYAFGGSGADDDMLQIINIPTTDATNWSVLGTGSTGGYVQLLWTSPLAP